MKQLRIAQVANFIAPNSGGIKIAIEALAKGYVEDGHRRMLVMPGDHDSRIDTEHGTIVQVSSPRVSDTYRMILRVKKVIRALEAFRPTSIEVSDKWTLSRLGGWAKRNGIGSVLFSHERLVDMAADYTKTDLVRPPVLKWNRILARWFDAVVVTSRYSASEWDGTSADLRLIPLGVDLELFSPDKGQPTRLDEPVSAQRPAQICYFGRMSHEKYPHLAVETAVELHRRQVPFELHMYGDGPDSDQLKKLAGDAPVVFEGFVDGREEVAKLYAKSDLALSPCPTETFGLAPLEALASGTPVVTANVGGAHETVDETCGESGRPDGSSLASATQRLIDRLGPELRAAARARAEQYPWSKTVRALLDLHQELSGK